MPKERKVIFGIDPGFGRCGFGVVMFDGSDYEMIDTGCITTETETAHQDRLLEIEQDIMELLTRTNPEVVVVEELFFGKSSTTAMKVAEARGVVLAAVARAGLPLIELKPNQIKLAVTGDGNADKTQMQQMVKRLLSLSSVPKPDDAADALAVAIAGSTINLDL